VRRFHALGADAFLIGETLVRSGDPGEAVQTIRGITSRHSA
jgi:indole-3-glycerol phosphate synthase